MSIKVMTAVWEKSKAKGSVLLLMLAIADYAHDDFTGAYPSISTLADKTRMSDRNIQNLIKEAVELGELQVEYNAGKNGSNMYTIVLTGEKIAPVKSSVNTGEAQFTPPVKPSSPNPSLEPSGTVIAPNGARTAESRQTKTAKHRILKAMGEFREDQDRLADPQADKKAYRREVAPILSRINGRAGHVISEDNSAADRAREKGIPISFIKEREPTYCGEEYANLRDRKSTAFWAVNQLEKDYAISKRASVDQIERNRELEEYERQVRAIEAKYRTPAPAGEPPWTPY